MIYLFLTGKSSVYLDDIFTTLSLPAGVGQCYKFPDSNHSAAVKNNTPVLISYYDREAEKEEQFYIPLRCGTLKSCTCEEEQFYYDVTLQEHCHAEDEKQYSNHILEMFQKQTRHKDEDGNYVGAFVIENDDSEDKFIKKDPGISWKRTAEKLGDRPLFQKYYSVFTKLELLDRKGKQIKPADGKEYDYDLIVGKDYSLKLTYFIPQFNADSMSVIPVCLEDSRDACGVLKKESDMGARQGKIEYKLWPVHKAEMLLTSLTMVIKNENVRGQEIRYSKKAVDMRIRSRIRKGARYGILGFCIAAICISSILNALPYSDIIEDARALLDAGNTLPIWKRIPYEISMMLDSCKYVYSPVCGIVTTVATFFLVKFTGKAKL